MRTRNALAVGLLVPALAAGAQEATRGATRVSPGGTTRVYVMAGFDEHCQSLAFPKITIVAVPAKGQVTFREGQVTTVQSSLSGKCVGQRVQGVGIYYTARGDASGADTFAISARLGSGETAERVFQLTIAE